MAHIDIVTANSAPYIYNLTPIPGRPDRYTMEGQFADVFKTLQVMNRNKLLGQSNKRS